MKNKIEEVFRQLLEYCERESFKGYDPYDGLNSSLFQAIPMISKNRLTRLIWIQAFKRSPINLRVLAGINKEYNPKALGLFLSGYTNLFKIESKQEYLDMIDFLSDKLLSLSNNDWSGKCWGYNFDWQARAFFQPKFSPTVVATSYVGNAFLDAFEITGDSKMLMMARSACDFILNDLNRNYDDNGNFAFTYSPLDRNIVFNASLLGSRLLSRVYMHTKETHLIEAANKSVIYCCENQRADGSWTYGTKSYHQWVDNFHTGYNLECIAKYNECTKDNYCDDYLNRGLSYYIKTFFTEAGIPKYFNNSIYPIDIHNPAQMIITFSRLGKFEEYQQLIEKVLNWTIEHMQSNQGFFYYQIRRYYKYKIPYMRWAQAWMFFALSEYLLKVHTN